MIRPPIIAKKMLKKCLWTIGFLGVGLFLMVISMLTCQEYRVRESRAVTLDAVVVDVELHSDSENGDDYYIYVLYTYEGQEYTSLYSVSKESEWMDRIGSSVTITVDSLEATLQPEDLIDKLFFTAFFGLPLICAGCFTAFLRGRMSYVAMNGLTEQAIRKDLISKQSRKVYWLPLLVCSVGLLAWSLYIADIDGVYVGGILLSIMVLPFGIVLLVKYMIGMHYVRTEPYQLVTLTEDDEMFRAYIKHPRVFCEMTYGYDPEVEYYDMS